MKTHVLRGSKQEIVERLGEISGEVREAIVFEDEPAPTPGPRAEDAADFFAEMSALMVDVQDVDDSREAIYTRMNSE
jgi:hypothetical protein